MKPMRSLFFLVVCNSISTVSPTEYKPTYYTYYLYPSVPQDAPDPYHPIATCRDVVDYQSIPKKNKHWHKLSTKPRGKEVNLKGETTRLFWEANVTVRQGVEEIVAKRALMDECEDRGVYLKWYS